MEPIPAAPQLQPLSEALRPPLDSPAHAPSPLLARYACKKVVAVGAHPHDLELGAGGTLARLSEAGARVTMVVVCSPERARERFEEAKKAADVLGADMEVLYGEGELRLEDVKQWQLCARVDELVEHHEPALLITHASTNFQSDQVLVHRACFAAQRLRFFDMLCFDPSICHPVTTRFQPQAFVDITPVIETKLAAIERHASQQTAQAVRREQYRGVALRYGRLAGVRYAEALQVSRLRLG